MVFIEAPVEAQATVIPPQVMFDQCAMLNIPSTGNAVGLFSTTDLPGVPTGPFPQTFGWKPLGIGMLSLAIISALLGMGTVVFYSLGGQLEAEEVEIEVRRKMAEKRERGTKLQRVKGLFAKKVPVVN